MDLKLHVVLNLCKTDKECRFNVQSIQIIGSPSCLGNTRFIGKNSNKHTKEKGKIN